MTRKIISITSRHPRNRSENKRFGDTVVDGKIADIFINRPANEKSRDLLNTVYHELTHAIIGLYDMRISGYREEKLCQKIAHAVEEVWFGPKD